MGETLEQILAELARRGAEAGEALAREQELEDQRAAVKADAIVRVMKRDNLAATPAEKIVETDEQYFRHRAEQRASIVARFRAAAEYESAKAAATHASLVTPAVIDLQAQVEDLTAKLKLSKRETDLKEIALRRANKFLSHRIDDVNDLTRANQELSARLGVEPRTVAFDTLEPSRESLTAVPYTAETA